MPEAILPECCTILKDFMISFGFFPIICRLNMKKNLQNCLKMSVAYRVVCMRCFEELTTVIAAGRVRAAPARRAAACGGGADCASCNDSSKLASARRVKFKHGRETRVSVRCINKQIWAAFSS